MASNPRDHYRPTRKQLSAAVGWPRLSICLSLVLALHATSYRQ